MYELSKEFRFDAAHTLDRRVDAEPSRRIHGHSYRAEVVVRGRPDPATGMIIDLGLLDQALHEARDGLDHRFLDEINDLGPATMENLSAWIWRRLAPKYLICGGSRCGATATAGPAATTAPRRDWPCTPAIGLNSSRSDGVVRHLSERANRYNRSTQGTDGNHHGGHQTSSAIIASRHPGRGSPVGASHARRGGGADPLRPRRLPAFSASFYFGSRKRCDPRCGQATNRRMMGRVEET